MVFLLLLYLHGQSDSLLWYIYRKHLYIHYISHADSLQGMLNKAVRNLGNMNQTILMDTDIYKHSKINDIADGSL